MKKLLALIMAFILLPCAILLTSCDKIKDLIDQDIVKNGLFKKETVYNVNETVADIRLSATITFNPDGTGTLVNNETSTTETITDYEITKNVLKYVSKGKTSYCDYYKDFIGIPAVLSVSDEFVCLGAFTAVREGQVVSERSSTDLAGYHFDLYVKQGTTAAAFTGDNKSKGYAYRYAKNGELNVESPIYLAADQISGYDSSTVGQKIVEVSVKGSKYKAILNVVAAE